jgi:hypothetical protein
MVHTEHNRAELDAVRINGQSVVIDSNRESGVVLLGTPAMKRMLDASKTLQPISRALIDPDFRDAMERQYGTRFDFYVCVPTGETTLAVFPEGSTPYEQLLHHAAAPVPAANAGSNPNPNPGIGGTVGNVSDS